MVISSTEGKDDIIFILDILQLHICGIIEVFVEKVYQAVCIVLIDVTNLYHLLLFETGKDIILVHRKIHILDDIGLIIYIVGLGIGEIIVIPMIGSITFLMDIIVATLLY